MKHDIVYILKNNIDSDEIRYSLRSVCENFPYNKIWFYGGCPEGIRPDEWVQYIQPGDSKWHRATASIAWACRNDDITEDFWLFNDDFFVMKRIRSEKPHYGGTLQERVKRIEENRRGLSSGYSRRLRRTMRTLKMNGYKQLDYALHIPMLINRKKAIEVFDRFPDDPMFRSLYGNYWDIGGEIMKDVKVRGRGEVPPDPRYLSTDDTSFEKGPAGIYIRNQFPEPCKYELCKE